MAELSFTVLRALLIGVFSLALGFKLFDRKPTLEILRKLYRLPSGLVFGLVVLAEAIVIVLIAISPRLAGFFGVFIVAAFTTTLIQIKINPHISTCRCFGQISNGTVGTSSFIRNGLLMLAFIHLAIGPGYGA